MAIRYDKQFSEDIRKVVSNFNRKVARLEKQERELIPEKISVKDLKNQFISRYELKRKLNELKRFSQRGVEEVITTEKGIKFTKWGFENLKREVRRAKYVTNREIKSLSKGLTPLTITRKSSFNLAKSRMKILDKDINNLTQGELNKLTANINRVLDYDQKAEQFQDNFTSMIFSEYGISGAPKYIVDGLTEFFSKLTPQQLLKLNKISSEVQAITDYSPTKGNQIAASRMRDILKSLYDKMPELSEQL